MAKLPLKWRYRIKNRLIDVCRRWGWIAPKPPHPMPPPIPALEPPSAPSRVSTLLRYSVGLIFFVCAAAAALSLWQSASSAQSKVELTSSYEAQQYADRARIEFQNCDVVAATADVTPCKREARERAREAQRKEYDLEAQRITAIWTEHVGIAALVGMAVSILGAGLIYVTFAEARRTNKIAQEAADIQTRPWLSLDIKFLRTESTKHMGFIVYYDAIVENIGQTAAIDISIGYKDIDAQDAGSDKGLAERAAYPEPMSQFRRFALLPGEKRTEMCVARFAINHHGLIEIGSEFLVQLSAHYRWGVHRERRITGHWYKAIVTRPPKTSPDDPITVAFERHYPSMVT